MNASLGGDRELLSGLHPPSSRNRTEFTLREITTSSPLISQVTEPSVTWQSRPGSRPLPVCSSERFIDFVGWRFSLNPWFDLTELRELCFAFFFKLVSLARILPKEK